MLSCIVKKTGRHSYVLDVEPMCNDDWRVVAKTEKQSLQLEKPFLEFSIALLR